MNRPIIKNYRSGRVSSDGNGMVGGSWWGQYHLGYKDIKIADIIPEGEGKAKERLDYAWEWMVDKLADDTIRVEAYFDEGKDDSVGLGYYCDMDETFPPDANVVRLFGICPFLTESELDEILNERIPEISEEGDGYELYEPDYQED